MLFILNPSPSQAAPTQLSAALFADPARGTHAGLLTFLWPRRVAYQHIRFLHALFVLASFALSNVVPVLFPTPSRELEEKWAAGEAQQILQLSGIVAQEGASRPPPSLPPVPLSPASPVLTRSIAAHAHVQTLLHAAHGSASGATFPFLDAHPLPAGAADDGSGGVAARIAAELEDVLLDTKLREDNGPLRSAVDDAVERQRRRERWAPRPSASGSGSGFANGGANGGVEGRGSAGGSGSGSRRASPVRFGPQNAEWLARLQRAGGGESGYASGTASPRRPGYVRGRSRSLG